MKKRKSIFDGLDQDLRETLKAQLRDAWSHNSTAIEGNSLTLGETKFVIEEGLTVSGKPLRDHNEVLGHAKAINLLYEFLDKEKIGDNDLFALHKSLMPEDVVDIYKPIGAWKREPNGAYIVTHDGKQDYVEFSSPENTPALMKKWKRLFNERVGTLENEDEAAMAYAEIHVSFTSIHPFFDGNGRLARLVANLPALKSGLPPILIPKEKRFEYITLLGDYTIKAGAPGKDDEILIENDALLGFATFIRQEWRLSIEIFNKIRRIQERRRGESN